MNYLLKLTSYVNLQTHASMLTPLHLVSQNNSIEIARLLISAGAKLDLKDIDGKVCVILLLPK